jgi:hypothetical protein
LSNISQKLRRRLAPAGPFGGGLADDLWHNDLNVCGDGHLKRPLFAARLRLFPKRRTMKNLNKVAMLFAAAAIALHGRQCSERAAVPGQACRQPDG